MKNLTTSLLSRAALFTVLAMLTGCEVIGSIFGAGVYTGMFIVIFVIVLIIFLVTRIMRRK